MRAALARELQKSGLTMIKVTRLNGSGMILNALLIERIEATPDTVIRLVTGTQYVVRQSPEAVQEAVVAYLQSLREDVTTASLAHIARMVR